MLRGGGFLIVEPLQCNDSTVPFMLVFLWNVWEDIDKALSCLYSGLNRHRL
jgi:hypothetical protein